MKNIILSFIAYTVMTCTVSAQTVLNEGRPADVKPAPVVMSQDIIKKNDRAEVFTGSDQDNPNSEERTVVEDVIYPVDLETLKADILSGLQSTDLEERFNDLTQQIYDLTLFNERLREENSDIKRSLSQCCAKGDTEISFLIQNTPNPATDLSTVDYYLSDNIDNAQIIISTVNGEVIDTYSITKSGYNSIDISAQGYSSGYYVYSLMNQDRVIDSKILIVTD